MSARIRVLLADDHALVRAGIGALLERIPDVEVAGEASSAAEAITLLKGQNVQVVFMDIAMDGMNGIEGLKRILAEFPGVKVIMLSMHAEEEYVAQALLAGASGYILKDDGITGLRLALEAASRGETYISAKISKSVIDDYCGPVKPLDQLSGRQREILQLIAQGKSTKEIASVLKLSPKTVETHRAELMDRLNIHDVPGLVRFAIRAGLIKP